MTIQRLAMMIALLYAVAGSAQAQVMLKKAVISNVGGRVGGSTTTLEYTIGQTVAGRASNATTVGQFGFWFSPSVSGPSSVDVETGAGGVMAAQVSPNPARERTTLAMVLGKSGDLEVGLYDVNGRLVSRLYSGERGAGSFDLPIDLTGVASGQYYVAISVPGALLQRGLTVVR